MIRVALYLRVSKDKKGGISIDVQREACEQHAARAGWVIVAVYIDDGKSAYTDVLAKRPRFQAMLLDAAAGRFDVVLVYKFDRFARRRKVYFQQIDELQERYGVAVKSATESDDWLSVGFNGLMAEQYSRMLAARMTDVRRWEVIQQRLHVGRVPVGYTRERGVLSPSDEAPAVIRLGQLYATGQYSTMRVAEVLNDAGYRMPGGGLFKQTAIKEIVNSPIYAGLLTYHGATYPGQHPPLWDTALWAQIRRVRGRRTYQRSPDRDHQALLTGRIFCARCGAPMSHHPQSSNPALRYYRCTASARHQESPSGLVCTARCGYADSIEATVLAWLHGLTLLPHLIDEAQRLAERLNQRDGPDEAALTQQLRRLARSYGDGGYTDEEYQQRRDRLLAQIRAPRPPSIDPSAITPLLSDLPLLMARAEPAERRAIVDQLLNQVYAWRHDVLALRPTAAASLFFQVADAGEWLNAVQIGVRSAPSADSPQRLRRLPTILAVV